MKLQRKLIKVGNSICVPIPSDLIKFKQWKLGQEVNFKPNEKGEIVLF